MLSFTKRLKKPQAMTLGRISARNSIRENGAGIACALTVCLAFSQVGQISPPVPLRRRSVSLSRSASVARTRNAKIAASYNQLPMSFEENRGQADRRVKFLSRGRDYTLYWTASEVILATKDDALRMNWVGGNPEILPHGVDRSEGSSNYLIGSDPQKWVTEVPSFTRL